MAEGDKRKIINIILDKALLLSHALFYMTSIKSYQIKQLHPANKSTGLSIQYGEMRLDVLV
jgi:hypothetical protein